MHSLSNALLNDDANRITHNAYLKRKYREANASPEQKSKRNQYQKAYREKISSSEQKAKQKQYKRNYRSRMTSAMKNTRYINQKRNLYLSSQPSQSSTTWLRKVLFILIFVYFCCDQLWYRPSVLNAEKLTDLSPVIHEYLEGRRSLGNAEWVCKTCDSHLVKNKIPPCAVVNGLAFPRKPKFFDLSELECRLLAPRIAFQKLMQAPRGKQLKIYGNIVNVPADVASTVSILPRLPSEAGTIKINLKRKLQYTRYALSFNVRPQKVVQAADWLIRNSSLYKDEDIVINPQWANQYDKEIEQQQNMNDPCSEQSAQDAESSNSNSDTIDDEDNESENEDELPAGVTSTKDFSPKRQSFIQFSTVYIIYKSIYNCVCEDKKTVSPAVENEMERLRNEDKPCLSLIYAAQELSIKLSFLNASSLHKHINDVRADINIFEYRY